MLPVPSSFRFDYYGSELVYGRGCIDRLGVTLDEHGLERALVVCGRNVGANEELMGPIRESLGDRLAGVFDETTPTKAVETAFDGISAMREHNADVLIGVGGGSSINIARGMSALASDGRTLADLQEELDAGEGVSRAYGDETAIPTMVVPTTFAGADISGGGALIVSEFDDPPRGELNQIGISGRSAISLAMFYDPDLFETAPVSVLTGSAMNGFNKGIETIYARAASPFTDATSVHGLRMLSSGLPRLREDDPAAIDRSVAGVMLVQFKRRSAIIHGFGHGFSRRYSIQQGVIHGILAPHVLRYVFQEIEGRRELIAHGLDIETSGMSNAEIAEAIVAVVTDVRDALAVPTHLRDVDPVDRGDFPEIASFIYDDPKLDEIPTELDPDVDEIERILHEAW